MVPISNKSLWYSPQANCRDSRSTIDQVLQLCSTIEDGFQLKQKTAVALVDLTAAYDTVWHQGLQLKLLRTIRDKHLVAFTMETLSNRRFVLRSGVRRKFEWGGFIHWRMVSIVFGVRCLWRHIHVFQTNVLAKFALVSHSRQNKDNCFG